MKISLERSRNGFTYRATISGKVRRIDVEGHTRNVHIGLDILTLTLVRSVLTLNRRSGFLTGKPIPAGVHREVEDALLTAFEAITIN